MDSYPTGPVLIWELAGRPNRDSIRPEPVPGVCAMCGQDVDQTLATATAIGGNFTDQYLFARPDSDRVCYACVWVCSGKPPDTLRMWTVVARSDGGLPPSHPKAPWGTGRLHLTARNDMRAVVELLADPPTGPWLVSIAESGQKHHAPYARVNSHGSRWTIRMDAVDITATPGEFRHVFGHVLRLREAGFSAGEIETLTPSVTRLSVDTLPVWHRHAAHLTPYRESALIHLACFLINKEHLREYVHAYGAPGPGGHDHVGNSFPQRAVGFGGPGPARPGLLDPGTHRVGNRHGHGDKLF